MESTKKATMKQLNALQEKSKIYMAGASRGNTKGSRHPLVIAYDNVPSTQELDVAILKSTTNQFHVVPKEKHVRTLKNAVHPAKPRREVQYLIIELLKRLYTANDWVIALKTLVVIHRLMRETDPSFIEELLKTAEEPVGLEASSKSTSGGGPVREKGGHILRVDDFLDMSAGSEGRFEFSEWVRAYGRYLDEQLSVYSSINFYLETEDAGAESRMRNLNTQDLLFQLPKLQRLLQRVTDCIPRGSTAKDPIVQLSLLMVVKESFKLYKVVSEGVINLADTFFEMSHLDAAKGLEMYKQYVAFTDLLQTYYTQVDQIQEIKSAMKSPLDFQLATPPPEFLAQMEEYVREAPRTLEDGAVVPASHKISPPLRRGQHSSRFGSRATAHGTSGGLHHDPGMVFPPGVGAKVGSQELSSPRDAAAAATGNGSAAAAVAGEIDLLSLDFDQDLSTDVPSSTSVEPNAPLADLFAQPTTGFAPHGNPFGGAPSPAAPPAAPPTVPPMGHHPGTLDTVGLGTTGFGEPPAPVMSQHSPQMHSAHVHAPAGLAPMGMSSSVYASRESLASSANGGGPLPAEPSPAKGPGGTNIRDSALHDPFAQFNSLRSSAEAKAPPKHMPSMQAVRASGNAPLTSVQLPSQQWGAPPSPQPTHPTQPFATPTASVSFSGPTGFTGGASANGSGVWGGPGGSTMQAPLASPGVSQSFTAPGYTGPPSGVYGAAPPVSPQPPAGGGFPVRFETHGGNGLL